MSPAVARAASGMSFPRYKGANPFDEASISGDFFEALTNSEFYNNAKVVKFLYVPHCDVRDISGQFRYAPFLALQSSNSFLTMLLLLSKYRMKSVPVIDLGEGKIENIITQSAVIHMLEECAGLQWFGSWGTKKLSELGLPLMKPNRVVKKGSTTDHVLHKYIVPGLSREAMPLAVADFGDDSAKAKEFANGYTLLNEMGFSSNNVSEDQRPEFLKKYANGNDRWEIKSYTKWDFIHQSWCDNKACRQVYYFQIQGFSGR